MRVLLKDANMQRSFWGLAICMGTYIHNRTPNSNSDRRTPHKRFCGNIPQADHLRTFASCAFIHVPEERRKKLDDRAINCRFVSYLEVMKGQKFWVPVKNTFLESVHVGWLDEKENTPSATIAPIPVP